MDAPLARGGMGGGKLAALARPLAAGASGAATAAEVGAFDDAGSGTALGVAVAAAATSPTGTDGIASLGGKPRNGANERTLEAGPKTNGSAVVASGPDTAGGCDSRVTRALEPGAGGGTVRGFVRIALESTDSAVLGARVGAAQPSARLAIRSNVASPRWPVLDTEHNVITTWCEV